MSQRRAALVVLALLAAVITSVPAHSDPPVALEDTLAPTEPTARDFPADFLPRLPLDAQEQRASVKDWKEYAKRFCAFHIVMTLKSSTRCTQILTLLRPFADCFAIAPESS